jgi:hypothetical protein
MIACGCLHKEEQRRMGTREEEEQIRRGAEE